MSLASTASMREVLNTDELLARCLGNISFATHILAKFQDRFEQDLLELDRAILTQDAGAVARIAHRIKGASANVAAAQLHESSAEIEQLGRDQRLSDISTHVDRLRQEWSRFMNHTSSLERGFWDAS
jgi:HPt (histidine-containing phosphotransfer) domain-containing protein